MNITDQQAIDAHLGNIIETPTFTLFSGFIAALRDARKFTKRNQDTGQKQPNDTCGDHGSWLGAIGYLALLDQVGGCFKPKREPQVKGNAITKALRYFGGFSDNEADAIYALRCSLAHDFGTINKPNNNKPSLTHIFTLCQGPGGVVIAFPSKQWDGNLNNVSNDNITWVNLERLGDAVEEIYVKLVELAGKGELEITLPGGATELAMKYSFWTPKNL